MQWRKLWKTLKETWPFCLTLLVIAVAFGIGCVLGETGSESSRYAGTFLQLFGLGTIAYGLHQTRKLFRPTPVWEKIKAWFRDLGEAFRTATPTEPPKGFGEGGAMLGGEGYGALSVAPSSLDERVALLEKRVEELQEDLKRQNQEQRKTTEEVRKQVKAESAERENAVRGVSTQIENVAIGGLHIEIVGLVWLLLGILATGFPDHIGYFFRV